MSESFLLLATYGSVVVFVAFFIRSMTGFGSALISIPLLALLFDLKVVVPLEAILEVAISVLLLRAVYHTIDRRTVLPMMVGVAIGALFGVYGLSTVETPLLKRVFGVAIMGYALYLYRDQRPPRYQPTSLGWGFTAGLGGGLIGGTVGTSGPPYVIYLSYRLRDKSVLRATLIALFAFDGLWRVGLFTATGLLTGEILLMTAAVIPALVLGTWLGHRAHFNISQRRFMQLVAVVLGVAGFLLFIG